ncbi:MAG: hypothetical protein J0L92_21595 [Deltaproteobacteria bacterium]|nr:hypothetical protein [Deltaproteobacteria bacterium]
MQDPKGPLVREYVSGKGLTTRLTSGFVIDCNGLDEATLRTKHPREYQWLLDRVQPVRAHNPRAFKRERWWIFGENQPGMRRAVDGLGRYIATTETAKHRVFVFLTGTTLAEGTVCVIGSDDALILGVLSSRAHTAWSLAAGATLEDRPRYTKTQVFDPFPFPLGTARQNDAIRSIAEELDAHRKRQLTTNPKLTMTAVYNVLETLRAGGALTEKEQAVHEQGLVSLLSKLHNDLDAAVFDAYGWPPDLTDEQIVERLVALNAERSAEELRGTVRYLRPDFQAPKTEVVPTQPTLLPDDEEETRPSSSPPPALPEADRVWPKDYFAQASAVRDLVASLPDGAKFDAGSLDPHFKGKAPKRVDQIARILSTFAKLGHFVTLAPGLYGRPIRRTA